MDEAAVGCPAVGEDLTWLFHRSAHRLRVALDLVSRANGLTDARDWIVLTALINRPGRTQLALGQDLGLDKTTLTALLDRLEHTKLVVRQQVPADRRARMPEITTEGVAVQARVSRGRDDAEAQLLAHFTSEERHTLRDLVSRLADGACDEGVADETCLE
ncbi:MAG: MarR family transcriptional regulator [Candidatus Nanopelagicales bacterium]